MSELKLFEVRGQYTVTVAKAVYAHDEQEACDIVNNLNLDLTDYCDGTVGCDGATVVADGYIEWGDAYEGLIYASEDEAEEYEEEDYDDDDEDEDDEEA